MLADLHINLICRQVLVMVLLVLTSLGQHCLLSASLMQKARKILLSSWSFLFPRFCLIIVQSECQPPLSPSVSCVLCLFLFNQTPAAMPQLLLGLGACCLSWHTASALHSHSPKRCLVTWQDDTAQGFIFIAHSSVTESGPSVGPITLAPREADACRLSARWAQAKLVYSARTWNHRDFFSSINGHPSCC